MNWKVLGQPVGAIAAFGSRLSHQRSTLDASVASGGPGDPHS